MDDKAETREAQAARTRAGEEIYSICWSGPESLARALAQLSPAELNALSESLAPLLLRIRAEP